MAETETETKHSIFYQERYEQPWTLTFMIVERFAALQKAVSVEDLQDPQVTYMNLEQALIERHGIESLDPGESEIEYLLQRLNELAEKIDLEPDQDENAPQGFGTAFFQYLQKLDAAGNCLYLAGGDYERARRYYRELDVRTVAYVVEHKVHTEWERHRVAMEASLYGFGGNYKGDAGASSGGEGADKTFDLTEGGDRASLMALSNALKGH